MAFSSSFFIVSNAGEPPVIGDIAVADNSQEKRIGEESMRRRLLERFPSLKNHRKSPSKGASLAGKAGSKLASAWSVYLIVSSRLPRTYVGVTTDFARRLKQHNGVLKGGAKASSAGRPWTLACIVQGFKDHSEACEFESKWKSISRKLPRKKGKEENSQNLLLHHREAALSRVKTSFDGSCLQIEWRPIST